MKILVDSDMLLFRACTATEVEVQLGPDSWARHAELPLAREFYWKHIMQWMSLFDCENSDVVHCFTDGSGFRRELYPGYKGNRKGKPKPIGYAVLRNELMREQGAFCFSQIEADDIIGLLATDSEIAKEGFVIASGDKDLRQIAGHHIWLTPSKVIEEEGLRVESHGDYTLFNVSEDYAERFTYRQYLSGDPTDSIAGCPSVGETVARRIVSEFDTAKPVECWEEIVRTYGKKGKVDKPAETALLQARLIRILRSGEYNFNTHQVQLWNPPTPTSV